MTLEDPEATEMEATHSGTTLELSPEAVDVLSENFEKTGLAESKHLPKTFVVAVMLKGERFAEALAYLDTHPEIEDEVPEMRGATLQRMGRHAEAVEALEAVEPRTPSVARFLASANVGLEDYAAAAAALEPLVRAGEADEGTIGMWLVCQKRAREAASRGRQTAASSAFGMVRPTHLVLGAVGVVLALHLSILMLLVLVSLFV